MASSSNEFSVYHMKCINFFRWTSLARSVIHLDSFGRYTIKPAPIICQLWFLLYFLNTSAKLVFLSFMVTGHLGPIEFLDAICGVDYFLCGCMVCIAYFIWQRYPIFEIIYRLWEIENRIYRRLGSPKDIKWEAEEKHSITFWAHLVLTCIGCCSLTIQFYEAPKYCVFTYSLIEADNAYLRLVFVFHEMLFLSHAWSAMSCSNGLCSFEAGNLSLIINQMAKAVDELCRDSTIIYYSDDFTVSTGNSKNDRDDSATAFQFSEKRNYDGESSDVNLDEKRRRGNSRTRSNRSGIEKMSAGISKTYDFRRILYDYQQLMIATEQFNAWVGYKIVGLSICGFCQYISSTTMAFQVIKIPGTGIGDIWFYIQDCSVAIYVTFRVFDSMSYVLPASMNFMNSVKKYMGQKGVVSGHIRKFQRTLRPVSLKLGPSPTRREGVLETMEMLVGYYLCVALW